MFYEDQDADGFGRPGITTLACVAPPGFSGNATDCDDTLPAVWAVPGEARELVASHGPGTGVTTLTWSAPLGAGGTAASLHYDTLRAPGPSDFTTPAECIDPSGTDTTSPDAQAPAPGGAYFYLVRAVNACPSGTGTLGTGSNGVERAGRACPASCTFNGVVSLAPGSSPPNLDATARILTVSAAGGDTFVAGPPHDREVRRRNGLRPDAGRERDVLELRLDTGAGTRDLRCHGQGLERRRMHGLDRENLGGRDPGLRHLHGRGAR